MRKERVNPSGAQLSQIRPSIAWYTKCWEVFLCATNDYTQTTRSTNTLLYG